MLFDDVLITADYDYTLTALDGTIPQRNLEAIRYFMENGGHFTVNTGRSAVAAKKLMEKVPVNAPFLMYNGSAAYADGEFLDVYPIALEPWSVLDRLLEEFPNITLEVHGLHTHYVVNATEHDWAVYEKTGWHMTAVKSGDDVGRFIKFNVRPVRDGSTSEVLRTGEPEEVALFDRIQKRVEQLWGEQVTVYRSGVRLLNINAKGTSKEAAARNLQKKLNKKILVCIGDAENDIPMLDGADFAFCPGDSRVTDRYETVCNCADGAVADVIYKKIPEILKNRS